MVFSNYSLSILIFLVSVNLLSFLAMLADKVKASHIGRRRISEGRLFFMAAIGGSLGVYAGMFAFRHKTKKWYFLLGIPLIFLQNLALAYLVFLFLTRSDLWPFIVNGTPFF